MSWSWTSIAVLDTGSNTGQAAPAYGVKDGKLYFRIDSFPGWHWRVWDPTSPGSFTELAAPGAGYDVQDAGGGCFGNDGKFYLLGGEKLSFAGNSAQLWAYDTGLDSWTRLSDAPDTFIYSNLAPWGTDIYSFGNNDGATYYTEVYKYDTLTDTWSDLGAILPGQRGDGICCVPVVGTGIFLVGGFSNLHPNPQQYWTNQLFDPSGPTVTDLSLIPTDYGEPGPGPFTSPFVDGTIPFYQGSDGVGDGTWLYDPNTDGWTQIINAGDFPSFDSDVYTFLMPGGIIDGDWYVLGFTNVWKLAGPTVTPAKHQVAWG